MERGLGDVGDPQAGVRFRVIVDDDGTTERWRQPRLVLFELLGCDPAEPRSHPRVATRRRAARQPGGSIGAAVMPLSVRPVTMGHNGGPGRLSHASYLAANLSHYGPSD